MSDTQDILSQLKTFLESESKDSNVAHVGTITQVGDGVIEIAGLSNAKYGELIDCGNDIYALALNLRENRIDAITLGSFINLSVGQTVKSTGEIFQVPVGEDLIGRVVDPLGRAVDGKSNLKLKKNYPVEKIAPGIIDRQPVTTPLKTGIKSVDALTPIGRGQRELIIGDRNTGKTSIAITTILNQHDQNIICIYVAIGQKKSSIAQMTNFLESRGAMKYTMIVSASASDPATWQYLAPYSATAMGEYFMDQGKDVLVVYDDLTKHAWAYREISLLMRRPAGREAYPGDVFYLHSRLLERACRLNEAKGGGSLTALPVIETQAGDVSAYIPTNVISITDGQIYLESNLFNSGIRPAMNTGLSVSRVGSAAQTKVTKQVSGTMKLDLAQYSELQAFSQFASDLDEQTKERLEKGARLTEILKQSWDTPYSQAQQVLIMWSANQGFLKEIPTASVHEWELGLIDLVSTQEADFMNELNVTKDKLTDEQVKKLTKIVTNYNKLFLSEKSEE